METNIHPSAVIDSTAHIENGVVIGAFSFIGAHTRIGKNTFIGPHCNIEERVTIGDNCHFAAHIFVAHQSEIADHVLIEPHVLIGNEGFGYAHDETGKHYYVPQIGNIKIASHSKIASHVFMDRSAYKTTSIGEHSHIGTFTHVAHNVRIGKYARILNDLIIAGSTVIGDYFKTLGRASATGHIEICDHVTVHTNSGINNDMTIPGEYAGFPLEPIAAFNEAQEAKMQLPELRKNIWKLKQKLGEKNEN